MSMLKIIGYPLSVVWLQFWLMRSTNVLGTRYSITNPYEIETNQPLIIVANHQSLYDIPPIIWYFRRYHPKFISKKELGTGIPSVSYNLRHGGSVLIDRKKIKKSIEDIASFGENVKSNNWSAVIFPEGPRSRNGRPRPFKEKGLLTLINHIPNGILIPLTINNSWKMQRYGKFPLGIGTHIKYTVHKPLKVNEYDNATIIKIVEQQITETIVYDK
jgi:1-acyl-sn-glycerol-3-phosphate acyltransferase